MVETFKRYLIGQDPLRIEQHWQYLYRYYHFRGAAIIGALCRNGRRVFALVMSVPGDAIPGCLVG